MLFTRLASSDAGLAGWGYDEMLPCLREDTSHVKTAVYGESALK